MNRAFILTTDAFLAVIVASIIAFAALNLAARFEDPLANQRVLEQAGRDFLTSLEKNGTLEQAVATGSNTGLVEMLGELPSSTCASIQIIENGTVTMQVNRTGCACGVETVVLRRTFLVEADSAQREMYARFGGCLD